MVFLEVYGLAIFAGLVVVVSVAVATFLVLEYSSEYRRNNWLQLMREENMRHAQRIERANARHARNLNRIRRY